MKRLLFIGIFMMTTKVWAKYYDTLPAGVRTIVYKNVSTTPITSRLDKNGKEQHMNVDIHASAQELEALDDKYVDAFLQLYKQYPEAFKALSLGHFKANAKANVSVDAYGFGLGLTDRMTAYIGVPLYKAEVKMNFNRPSSSSFKQVAEILQSHTGDDYAQSLGNLTENFYDLDGTLMQSLVVNGYGYNEVGDWQGSGPGDTEFGLMYNFHKETTWGLMLTVGGVAPTGRVDDPDLLQDVGFGDGQWDAFAEFGAGHSWTDYLSSSAYLRYTHQFASEKELRTPTSSSFPLSAEKDTYREKLGDIVTTGIGSDYTLSDWTSVSFSYMHSVRAKAAYYSDNAQANRILAENTESVKDIFRASATLSSITPFLKKNFLLPATFTISYDKLIYGTNTPNMDMYGFEFKMMF